MVLAIDICLLSVIYKGSMLLFYQAIKCLNTRGVYGRE